MAENVFAVTQTKFDSGPGPEYGPYLSSGIPLPNVEVQIRDGYGTVLPPGELGEICLRSDCMFEGYYQQPELSAERIELGWYHTRDLGLFIDGEIFVIGRVDDLLIVNGKNMIAHEIEDALNDVASIAPGRVLVGSLYDEAAGLNRLAVLAEGSAEDVDVNEVTVSIRDRVLSVCGVAPAKVEILPRGYLIKSSSGKLARAKSWEKWEARAERQA